MDVRLERFKNNYIYFVLIFWLICEVLFNSTMDKILFWDSKALNNAMSYIILALLMLQIIFFQKYQRNELMLIFLITLPIIYATINADHYNMMSTWIFAVASKDIDFDKLMKQAYISQLIMVLVVFYLFFTGSITEATMYRNSVLRHSFGFMHPNQLGIRVFLIVVCRCYTRRKNINFYDVILTFLAGLFVYVVPNSKTSYYSLFMLGCIMIIHLLSRMGVKAFARASSIAVWLALICNVGSVFLSIIDVNKYPWLRWFDLRMSRRFSMCHRTMQLYGITVWGQDVHTILKRHIIGKHYTLYLDNSYMSILLRYGIVVYVLFSLLYLFAMVYLKRANQIMLLEIMCLFAIYGVMENNFFSMSQNLFLLALSYPIYQRKISGDVIIPSRVRLSW